MQTKKTVLRPSQIVAYNLERLRRDMGWSQEEAARRLEPYLGQRWSRASFSSAVRSLQRPERKTFTVDELIALSRAFEVPIQEFLAPPSRLYGQPVGVNLLRASAPALDLWEIGDCIGVPIGQALGLLFHEMAHVQSAIDGNVRAIFERAVGHFRQYPKDLDHLSEVLTNIQAAVSLALETALDAVSRAFEKTGKKALAKKPANQTGRRR